MLLQRSTTRVCHALLQFPTRAPLVVLRIPDKGPSCTMWAWVKYHANPHSFDQDTLPIVFLISKEVVSYQIRGDICCPVESTPKIRSLAYLSNYIS
jgi:hypothetical protein